MPLVDIACPDLCSGLQRKNRSYTIGAAQFENLAIALAAIADKVQRVVVKHFKHETGVVHGWDKALEPTSRQFYWRGICSVAHSVDCAAGYDVSPALR